MDADLIEAVLNTIRKELATLANLRAQLHQHLDRYTIAHTLKQARMMNYPYWPTEPTSEQWESRGSDAEYLKLWWPNGKGPKPNPDAPPKRNTYIGNKPQNITLARQMVTNHRDQLFATRRLQSLDSTLSRAHNQIAQLAGNLQHQSAEVRRQIDA